MGASDLHFLVTKAVHGFRVSFRLCACGFALIICDLHSVVFFQLGQESVAGFLRNKKDNYDDQYVGVKIK